MSIWTAAANAPIVDDDFYDNLFSGYFAWAWGQPKPAGAENGDLQAVGQLINSSTYRESYYQWGTVLRMHADITGSFYNDPTYGPSGYATFLTLYDAADAVLLTVANPGLIGPPEFLEQQAKIGDDTFYGSALNDQIAGGAGSDLIVGGAGNDALFGSANFAAGTATENDTLVGGTGNDGLHAGNGDDVLRGGSGADAMYGGNGNDVYYVDNTADTVADAFVSTYYPTRQVNAGDGYDIVVSTVSYQLPEGVKQSQTNPLSNATGLIEELRLAGKRALGGSGNAGANTLIGNTADNTLTGMGGDDLIDGGAGTDTAGYSGQASDYAWVLNGNSSWTVTDLRADAPDGSDTLWNIERFAFLDQTITIGTATLASPIRSDFQLDGASDIVWRNGRTGEIGLWDMKDGNYRSFVSLGSADASWAVVDKGQYGAGEAELLMRNTASGEIGIRDADQVYISLGTVSTDWVVQSYNGRSDFNGDGYDDILWRNVGTGTVIVWDLQSNQLVGSRTLGTPGLDWQIKGTGDFNADRADDVLWQNTAAGEVGYWTISVAGVPTFIGLGNVDSSWQISRTGDFDGNGRSDLLWRSAAGDVATWNLQSNAGFTFDSVTDTAIAPTEQIATVGDYTGDGRDDILWRNLASGQMGYWDMAEANGNYHAIGVVSPQDDWFLT
jgi:Ca2+-binding RTX toxin-like protein